ncbi:MAG TPA: PIN domain-containing protein [Thermoguttaceae bacterium]|nr:PIN domain-containing protein [Thermoguttaceae bacterium]
MRKTVFDTSVLIRHWIHCGGRSPKNKTLADAESWGRSLVEAHDSNAVLTPVYIEFVAGARSTAELRLAEAYLEQFEIIDNRSILKQDWEEAERLARRVPRSGKPRQLVDCLVRAIANRLNRDVFTLDQTFPA